jgi:isocitrate dehydrogenase (NAD+)
LLIRSKLCRRLPGETAGEFDRPALIGQTHDGAVDLSHGFPSSHSGTAFKPWEKWGMSTPSPVFWHNASVSYRATLIPGDGIGPEVAEATVRALAAIGVEFEWERVELTGDLIVASHGELPGWVIESLERTKLGLKGPVTTPIAGGYQSVNVVLRKRLDLFANVRPVRNMPGLKTRYQDVAIDMVIFRENTEDLYAGLEHEVVKDVVTSLKVITRAASERIARYAFHYTRAAGRKKITAVHKANIMKLSDGMFLRCSREVAREYPEIEYKELIVDNASMQLVMRPEQFDVLLMPNLYGDIVSDLAAGLVGGLGMVPGANMGEKHAVFEAVHGSAPDIAGRGIANPTALMLSSVMMLEHLGERTAAERLQRAIEAVYTEGTRLTRDAGGQASTSQFTDAVIAKL